MMALTQVLLVIAMLMLALAARANETESVRLSRPVLSAGSDNVWTIDADVQVTLNSVLIDALKRGVPLVLSFHSVTQQYRVSQGDQLMLMTNHLDEALAAALNVRQWPIAQHAAEVQLQELMQQLAKTPEAFEIRFRTRLDSGQLPKPLQLNALTNRDWNLSTEWVRPQLSLSGPGSTP
jgi:hypothetical protein